VNNRGMKRVQLGDGEWSGDGEVDKKKGNPHRSPVKRQRRAVKRERTIWEVHVPRGARFNKEFSASLGTPTQLKKVTRGSGNGSK